MRVPPVAYGGTELVVSLLTEELVRRKHDVTLFASGDSVTSAHLAPGSETFLRGSSRNKEVLSLLNAVTCLEQAGTFDIVHNHTALEGMAMAGLVKTPVLTTLHGHFAGDWQLIYDRYSGWYNTISQSAKMLLPPKERFAGVIYNGIDCSTYPYNPGPREDFMLYLSRISHEKGAHLAVEVARRLGRRLVIAGNVDSVDVEYFETKVRPHVDGELIQYVGEADYTCKRDLLSRASCLIAPITWNEPFGLFMVEAMACGTPVVVSRRGSAPEVVEHGVTGYVVDSLDEMVEAMGKVHTISPEACRERAEREFSVERMTGGYLAAYERIAGEAHSKPRRLRRFSAVGKALAHRSRDGARVPS